MNGIGTPVAFVVPPNCAPNDDEIHIHYVSNAYFSLEGKFKILKSKICLILSLITLIYLAILWCKILF